MTGLISPLKKCSCTPFLVLHPSPLPSMISLYRSCSYRTFLHYITTESEGVSTIGTSPLEYRGLFTGVGHRYPEHPGASIIRKYSTLEIFRRIRTARSVLRSPWTPTLTGVRHYKTLEYSKGSEGGNHAHGCHIFLGYYEGGTLYIGHRPYRRRYIEPNSTNYGANEPHKKM